MYPPIKPPTPSDYAVILALVVLVFIGLGVAALVVAFRAPPEKHDLAVALEHRGFWLLGIGVGFANIFWLRRRFMD